MARAEPDTSSRPSLNRRRSDRLKHLVTDNMDRHKVTRVCPYCIHLLLFIILYFIGVCMSVYYCGIDSCSIKETFEFELKYMLVCTLYTVEVV